ncbi:hypothetical protein NQ317_004937 [Molorchus minor]|uniref:Uncharacterized protein n=1 Tax=Molorchus minor TaxID=1323400 RepID=A0ABQ9JWI1_9CUCU|nr:hypothetical protein NQ317_004937 [Molorchus minor]
MHAMYLPIQGRDCLDVLYAMRSYMKLDIDIPIKCSKQSIDTSKNTWETLQFNLYWAMVFLQRMFTKIVIRSLKVMCPQYRRKKIIKITLTLMIELDARCVADDIGSNEILVL